MKAIFKALGIGSITFLASCGNSNEWKIDGKITGLNEDDLVVLEGNNQGYWYPMDTIEVKSDGSFKYAREAQGYPDIYRLRVNGSALYFPIDSIESISITADAPDIAANHTLSGSAQARNLEKVDSLLNAAAKNGAESILNNEALKKELGNMLLADPAGIVTYYIISKTINGKPLFDPSDRLDIRYIGAVANAFNDNRPSDPRTSYLRRLYLSNRLPGISKAGANIPVTEVKAFDIKRFDNTGKEYSLLDLTESGKVVLLNFTAYAADESPAFNVALNNVYSKYHNQGFEIFQVSLDEDEYAWKQTAKNLPWITVLNSVADGPQILSLYNVSTLPTIFLFNRNGELVERVTDISTLDSSVAKLL